jgi:hypothetical protein
LRALIRLDDARRFHPRIFSAAMEIHVSIHANFSNAGLMHHLRRAPRSLAGLAVKASNRGFDNGTAGYHQDHD